MCPGEFCEVLALDVCSVFLWRFCVLYPIICWETGKIQVIFLCGWKPLFNFVAQMCKCNFL